MEEPLVASIRAFAQSASFEIAVRDQRGLETARKYLPLGHEISITWMPQDTHDARVAAAAAVRAAGFEPVPHVAARRIRDCTEFDRLIGRLADEAGVERLFVIAGDVATPIGEYASSLELLARCRPSRHGIRAVGVAGHPEGHPKISREKLDAELDTKLAYISDLGMEPFVITQFAFNATPIVSWIRALRERDNDVRVGVGLAGPANLPTLIRFARICGVGASTRALVSQGASIARMLTEAGPDPVIRELIVQNASQSLGNIRLHLFPFGGLARTAQWIKAVAEGHFQLHDFQAGFGVRLRDE